MDYLDQIETQLGRSLRPIQANRDFVDRLQNNLVQRKHIFVERDSVGLALLTTIVGVAAGAFLIWVLRRLA